MVLEKPVEWWTKQEELQSIKSISGSGYLQGCKLGKEDVVDHLDLL